MLSFALVIGASMLLADVVLPAIGWTWRVNDVSHLVALALPTITSFLLHKYRTFVG